jgi:phosphoesterase RecJ-like protein
MKSTHARPEDTEGLIEKLQEIETVQLAAIFETMAPDLLRVSLRSKDGINVSEIAQTFGGGGHPLAAGVRIGGNPEANKEKMLDCLRQSLKNIAP